MRHSDRPYRAAFLVIAIIGTIRWLAVFERKWRPLMHGYSEAATLYPRDSVGYTSGV